MRPGGRILLVDEDFGHPDHSMGRAGAEHHHGPELIDADDMARRLTSAHFDGATVREDTLGGEPAHIITATRSAR